SSLFHRDRHRLGGLDGGAVRGLPPEGGSQRGEDQGGLLTARREEKMSHLPYELPTNPNPSWWDPWDPWEPHRPVPRVFTTTTLLNLASPWRTSEDDEGLHLSIDLPGCPLDTVNLELKEGGTLEVKARRTDGGPSAEICATVSVDAHRYDTVGEIQARLHLGVLHVSFKRRLGGGQRQIKITTDGEIGRAHV